MVLAEIDTTQQSKPLAEIKGKVFNNGTDLPVAGAEVRIVGSKQKTVTDSQGRFRFSGDIDNAVTLEVSAPHFYTKTVQLNGKSDWAQVKVMLNEEAFIMGEIAAEDVSGKKVECNTKDSTGSSGNK
jgi:hypothetical protein